MPPVPTIREYRQVLRQMEAQGFRSLYHNSGAFGFPRDAPVHYAGWIGPPDASIRPQMRTHLRNIAPPYEANLACAAADVWVHHLPGVVWVMPMSHWSYELDFGSGDWMPAALNAVGLDGAELSSRANGAAV